MTTKTVSFESGHEAMVHDAQLDYYGKRLATASSDRTIKIFEVSGQQQTQVAQLRGHDGPVWQVAWAHPKFGMLLASASYDGKVCIWKEQQVNQWSKVFEETLSPQASVNSVSWASHTVGLVLAAACSDGTVWVFEHRDDQQWSKVSEMAHNGGCNAVSWGPDTPTGALLKQGVQGPVRQFVTAGCDNTIKIWRPDPNGRWSSQDNCFREHTDWVRDVSWAPSLGLLSDTIASCSEDKTVIIWTSESGTWRKDKVLSFPQKAWRVSWSPMGNILAISQGDNKVSLWKQSMDGDWQNMSTVADDSVEAKSES